MFVGIFFIFPLKAQYMDTLHNAFTSKKSFDFRYQSRNSFSNGDRIEVTSIMMGVTFGNKISIGGGYSWLQTSVSKFSLLPDVNGGVAFKNNKLDFRYLSYYIDFVFYKSKRWQLSSEVEAGAGLSKFQYLNNGETNKKLGNLIVLYNPAININFKIFRWVGLNSTIGYRFMLINDKSIGKQMNSPLISVGAGIYWSELVLAIFPKSKKIQEKLGPGGW